MRQIRIIISLVFSSFCLYFCSTDKSNLEFALDHAGNNRVELEKVLSHYKYDSLKYKAAVFLIENMLYHSYLDGPELKNYLKYYECISGNYHRLHHILDSLSKVNGSSFMSKLQSYNDLQNITSDLLINNIEWAFKVWTEQPWGKNIDFNDFCEYILPYRIGNEPPSYWREEIYQKYNPILDQVRTLPEAEDPFYVARILLDSIVKQPVTFTTLLPEGPHVGPDVVKWRSGTCRELADIVSYIFRAIGLPTATDYMTRGDNNADHYWCVMIGKDKKSYMIDLPSVLLMPVEEYDHPKAKVYRRTFSLNKQIMQEMDKPLSSIHPSYSLPLFIDVTFQYTGKWNQKIELNTDILYENVSKEDIVYLCVSRRQEWLPVDWTSPKKNRLIFNNIGGNIVFRLGIWNNSSLDMISDPFLLEKESGNIRFFKPILQTDTIPIYYKYHLYSEEFIHRMPGGVFEGSNEVDFRTKDTLFLINEAPKRLYNTIYTNSTNNKYRYIRYKGGEHSYCNIAEIEFYGQRNDSIPLTGKIIGTPGCFQQDSSHEYTNAFDGNPYTSFDYFESSTGWTGLDLGVPCLISKVRYVPRNRDNFIRKDDLYELFYWEDKHWKSAGIKQAKADSLLYVAPQKALLYLKNHTRGKDERIFEYRNGEVVFW